MNDVLQFFSRSADKYPGCGVGEHVADPTKYKRLSKIKNWRRMFSDLWEEDFKFEGKTYRTQQHALQAAKFTSAGYNDIAFQFCVESGSKLALGCGLDAMRARKKVMLSEDEMAVWNEVRPTRKTAIYAAKYCGGNTASEALVATMDAILVSNGPRLHRIVCERLMQAREHLQNL